MSLPPETMPVVKPQAMLAVPLGLASPLWGLFAGAAATGAAWWWMTRWARPANLEAMFAVPAKADAVIEGEVAALAAPVVREVIEAAPEPVLEAVAEATLKPIAEAVVEVLPESAVGPAMDRGAQAAPEPVWEAVTEPAPVLQAAIPEAIETLETLEVIAMPKTKKPTMPKTA